MKCASDAAVRTRYVLVTIGIAGAAGLLWVIVAVAPSWFVRDRTLEGLKVQNEIRTTLFQGLGGVVVLVGAFFTYRQLRTTREAQITERFTRAIEQLGHSALDVRLGGIYALERIARDSPADRPTIGEVLSAFVRSHAPWPPRLPGQYVAAAPIDQVPDLQVRALDVHTCLKVLGRGGYAPQAGNDKLDLSSADLRCTRSLSKPHFEGTNFRGTNLAGSNLDGAHLNSADFQGADLAGSALDEASLDGALFSNANLKEATLDGATMKAVIGIGANLEEAWLAGADLGRTLLLGANLRNATLVGARLDGAWLASADMKMANMTRAVLEGALADKTTIWPDGFDPEAAGVRDLTDARGSDEQGPAWGSLQWSAGWPAGSATGAGGQSGRWHRVVRRR